MTITEAIEIIDRWQANFTVTYILDKCYAKADEWYFTTPTLTDFLIELANKLEEVQR